MSYHYITVPGHPSDLAVTCYTCYMLYHYITVPGHPSDLDAGHWQEQSLVPLHYSSGASIRQENLQRM